MRHGMLFAAAILAIAAPGAVRAADAPTAPASEAAQPESGYDAVIDALREAGRYVEAQTEPGSIDRAEGYRYALRRVEMLNGWFLDVRNGWHPTIDRCPTKYCKYGFDNPDAVYNMIKPLDPRHAYRIRGNRGTVPYITFQLFSVADGLFHSAGTLELGDMKTDAKGNFDILVATDNPGNAPNFIRMAPGRPAQLLVRQMLNDWNKDREASLSVEVVDNGPPQVHPAALVEMPAFDVRARAMARTLMAQMRIYREMLTTETPNQFKLAYIPTQDGGFPTNFTNQMTYEVGPDEAVVIAIPKVDVVFGNIQMGTLWGESPDYATRLISYNNSQAYLDKDGVYRYVISQTDPGTPNWLDAAGAPKGGIFIRWQSPRSEIRKPVVTRVKLSELRSVLPATHPVVTPEQRALQLKARMDGYNRRMNPIEAPR